MKSFTRKEYMAGQCSHSAYYAQFVSDRMVELVREKFPSQILASEDDHFSNIPLKEKDALGGFILQAHYFPLRLWQELECLKSSIPASATLVCTVCEAMRQAREAMLKPETLRDFRRVVRIGKGEDGDIFCNIKVMPNRSGLTCLSITGVEGPKRNGDCSGGCGQIDDTIAEKLDADAITFAPGWTKALAQKFLEVWGRWHLNDMTAGSPRQEAYLREHGRGRDYSETRAILEKAGLSPDQEFIHNGEPHKYGHAWLKEELPEDVLIFLASLPETDKKPAWV